MLLEELNLSNEQFDQAKEALEQGRVIMVKSILDSTSLKIRITSIQDILAIPETGFPFTVRNQ